MNKDKFLGFYYNGIEVNLEESNGKGYSLFRGFIKNEGEDLMFFNAPEFENEFVSLTGGEKTFLTGTTSNSRKISFTVVLLELTLVEYKEFLRRIGHRTKGILQFTYNVNYGFDVKLDSIGNGIFFAVEDCGNDKTLYNVEIELEFVTIGDWRARWVGTEVSWKSAGGGDLVDNDGNKDFISGTSPNFKISNKHEVENYFVIEHDSTLKIENKAGTETLIQCDGKGTFYSEYGICINDEGFFTNSCSPISIAPQEDIELKITNAAEIIPTSRDII